MTSANDIITNFYLQTSKHLKFFIKTFTFGQIVLSSALSFGSSDLGLANNKCPFSQPTSQQICSHRDSENLIKSAALVSHIACKEKLTTEVCQSAIKKYPFLLDRLNTCTGDDLCDFSLESTHQIAIEGCKRGLKNATLLLKKEFLNSVQFLENLSASYGIELAHHFKESAANSWEVFKSCINSQSDCSPTRLKEYFDSLPTTIKNEIATLSQEMEQYQCLSTSGRYELFCFQSALQSKELLSTAVPGRIFARVGGKIIDAAERTRILPPKRKPLPSEVFKAPKPKGLARLELAIGRKVEMSTKINGSQNRPYITIKDSLDGKEMGSLTVNYDPSKKTIKVGTMMTTKKYRKMGVGETLLEAAINQFPETEFIAVDDLEDTNREVIEQKRSQGLSVEDAIKESPAYKIRSNLGFGEIVQGSIDKKRYSFKVKKSHK